MNVSNICRKCEIRVHGGLGGKLPRPCAWGKERVARSEETRNIVQSVQQIEAEYHEPARVGGRHLVVAPGVTVPRPFCITRAGDSQECVRRDMDRLSGESRNMITVRTICEHRAQEE